MEKLLPHPLLQTLKLLFLTMAQEGNRTGYIGVKSAPGPVLKDRGGPNQGPNIAPTGTRAGPKPPNRRGVKWRVFLLNKR